jgi:hypothetical protein
MGPMTPAGMTGRVIGNLMGMARNAKPITPPAPVAKPVTPPAKPAPQPAAPASQATQGINIDPELQKHFTRGPMKIEPYVAPKLHYTFGGKPGSIDLKSPTIPMNKKASAMTTPHIKVASDLTQDRMGQIDQFDAQQAIELGFAKVAHQLGLNDQQYAQFYQLACEKLAAQSKA